MRVATRPASALPSSGSPVELTIPSIVPMTWRDRGSQAMPGADMPYAVSAVRPRYCSHPAWTPTTTTIAVMTARTSASGTCRPGSPSGCHLLSLAVTIRRALPVSAAGAGQETHHRK